MKKLLIICLVAFTGLCVGSFIAKAAAQEKEAELAITKALKMDSSITTPPTTFSFKFEPISLDGDENAEMPVITEKTVAFSESDNGSTDSDGVKTCYKEITNVLSGVNWKRAGMYVYELTEVKSVKETLPADGEISYSPAKYKIIIYVANGSTKPYVAVVSAEVIETDGEAKPGDKVDGKPGGANGERSDLIFTNVYSQTSASNNPRDYSLAVSKTVKSDGEHDYANRELYFEFQITVTKSQLNNNANQKYRAYVMDLDNNVVTSQENGAFLTDPEYGGYIEFETGAPVSVKLKHGQWLSFVGLEAGASYKITESGTPKFTPNLIQTVKGEKQPETSGKQGESLSALETKITVGEDRADFTNIFSLITVVGVRLDRLPFAIIGLLALGCIVWFALAKKRKEEDEEDEK